MAYKKITVEEHFSTPEHLEKLWDIFKKKYPDAKVVEEEKYIDSDIPFIPSLNKPYMAQFFNKLYDIGTKRLESMDRSNIDLQVLSLISPGVQVFETKTAIKLARSLNDKLSTAVQKNPARFAGLASIAPQEPDEAADELVRAVKDLGLKGAVINSHTKGEYLDDPKYWVIFEQAEKLNVPIYLHPRAPSPDMIKPYLGYPMLHSAMLGFGAETGLHAMRLMCSGVFDKFPGLKIILGHMGEALPFWLWRLDRIWKSPLVKKREKTPSEYLKDNFFISTSGMYSKRALKYTIEMMGADNILFACDYPMDSSKEGVQFINETKIEDSDKEKIFHLNAEKLFFQN